jgi:type II secretion system protein I
MPSINQPLAAFTLIEVLVALAVMAVVVPVIYQGMHVASLAGEVAERKSIAARIGDRVLYENVLAGPASTSASTGSEKAGPYQFNWVVKDEPWNQINNVNSLTTANGINQASVNSTVIHQLSVEVNYVAQGKKYSVHLATLINKQLRQ